MQVQLESLIEAMQNTRYNQSYLYQCDTGEVLESSKVTSTSAGEYLKIPYLNEKELIEEFLDDCNEKEKQALEGAIRDSYKQFYETLRKWNLYKDYCRFKDYAYEEEARYFCKEHDITVLDTLVRPYIVCHMVTSLDNKVTGPFLKEESCQEAIGQYYRIHAQSDADGFACGRVTMQESFPHSAIDVSSYLVNKESETDYIADAYAPFYCVAFDRKGKLFWNEGYLQDEDPGYDGSHIIEVLTKQASPQFRMYLREKGISYIIAGETDMDLSLALSKLYRYFGIRKLLLEGGSEINTAFVQKGYIDELSLVIAPIMAGSTGKPLFESDALECYELKNHKRLEDQAVYCRYVKK